MPRYDDRRGDSTRLYVGHLSSRTRSRDLERVFSKYGRHLPGLKVNLERVALVELMESLAGF